jgi:Leucine-rich repeat (LRR) protein
MPQDIGVNKSIYELSLERNVLKYIPSIIIKLPYLKTLHLGSNQIKATNIFLKKSNPVEQFSQDPFVVNVAIGKKIRFEPCN